MATRAIVSGATYNESDPAFITPDKLLYSLTPIRKYHVMRVDYRAESAVTLVVRHKVSKNDHTFIGNAYDEVYWKDVLTHLRRKYKEEK